MGNRENVSRIISPKDTMLDKGQEEKYFKVGEGALDICLEFLKGRVPERIIDFPSGYGRVTRWFRNQWPEAKIVAVEIEQDALSFVKDTFQAIPVLGDPHLRMVIPGDADLIFAGSMLTHFDEWQWDIFLDMCVNALSQDGLFVFTAHGRINALLAKTRHLFYGDLIDTKILYNTYRKRGFSFLPYSKNTRHLAFRFPLPNGSCGVFKKSRPSGSSHSRRGRGARQQFSF